MEVTTVMFGLIFGKCHFTPIKNFMKLFKTLKDKRAEFVILFFSFFLCLGTTFIKLSLTEMVKEAKAIVRGHCVAIEEEADAPFTKVSFYIEEVIKGEVGLEGQTLAIRVPGGSLKGYKVYVPGAERFQVGEEDMVFLTAPDAKGRWSILSSGKLPIYMDKPSGQTFIRWQGKERFLNDFLEELELHLQK